MSVMGRNSKRLLVTAISIAMGCDREGGDWEELKRAAQEETERTVVEFMSVETMFSDPKLRGLAEAAGKGDVSEVERLVRAGVDVNGRGFKNTTPLVWAIRNRRGFEKLLELGADPNILFGNESSIVHWAARSEDARLLRTVLDHGGIPNLRAGELLQSPLFDAVQSSAETTELLLDSGADIDLTSSEGATPIFTAVLATRYDIVLVLLERGAKVNGMDGVVERVKNIVNRDKRVINPAGDQGAAFAEVVKRLGL